MDRSVSLPAISVATIITVSLCTDVCIVNGDGLDDLIVGAIGSDPSNKTNAGKSYVVFGKINDTAINLSAIASGMYWLEKHQQLNHPSHHRKTAQQLTSLLLPVAQGGLLLTVRMRMTTDLPFQSPAFSPLITNPPVPLAIVDRLIAVLSVLPTHNN
jgi:hypothetical protein